MSEVKYNSTDAYLKGTLAKYSCPLTKAAGEDEDPERSTLKFVGRHDLRRLKFKNTSWGVYSVKHHAKAKQNVHVATPLPLSTVCALQLEPGDVRRLVKPEEILKIIQRYDSEVSIHAGVDLTHKRVGCHHQNLVMTPAVS